MLGNGISRIEYECFRLGCGLPLHYLSSVLVVQFEGSLGKLTVSSVNNPRKMIDAVVTSRSEDDVSNGGESCST